MIALFAETGGMPYMCGIAGFCNFSGDRAENIERMKHRMLHRGPDAGGTYLSEDGCVALGHRRLSIVDLSESGAQPMTSHSGRYVLVYNGEIYNYKKLANRLLSDGQVEHFNGTSDTEVLLEAFEAYGVEQTLAQCKGMFAIALYDKQERELILVRDRVGEKPLYYGMVNGSFVFASELGCISALEGFQNPIDRRVLNLYFSYGYIPAPWSIYEGIYKLEPGTVLQIQAPFREWKCTTYWSMRDAAKKGEQQPFPGDEIEAADELERLLKASIADQMVADVPVGAFLSAGIDSSTVVALMQSLHHGKIRSFTIGMEDKDYNEAVYAKEIARHLGTEHTELYITEQDAKAVIPKLGTMFGEPFADSSQIPTYLVSKMTREHVTVSLSGDGGDELFCGYGTYRSIERIWNQIKSVPYGLRAPVSALVLHSPLRRVPALRIKGTLLGASGPADLYNRSHQSDQRIRNIGLCRETRPCVCGEYPEWYLRETNHNIMLMDMLMYHPDDILVKVDRTAMAVSLETRVPMLDRDLVEFAWSLPIDKLRGQDVGKKVLRDVLYRYVPKELMERPKKGFSIPLAKWLLEPSMRQWAEALLDWERIRRQGLLDAEIAWSLWNDFTQRGRWCPQIWYILMFQAWLEDCGVQAVRV